MKQTCLQTQYIYSQILIPFRKNLGCQLRQLREDSNLTAYQVSKLLEFQITAQDIHDYENGRYNMPTFETVALLASIYRKTVRVEFDEFKN